MRTIQQPALLERETELAALDELIAQVADGGRLLVVEGAPGIGKTRLLSEARRRARESGVGVLSARGLELEHELAYGVVRQLFEPVVAGLPDAGREELLAGPAAPAAGVLDPAGPVQETGTGNPDATFSTLHGLYWLAAGLAARGPLVLVIDDLHWCDLSSLRWLAYLLPRIEDLPLRIVAAGRPLAADQGASLRAHLTEDPLADLMRPAPLSEDACRALIEQVLGREPEAAFCAACHTESRGNPLWVRELARAVAAEGLAPTADNAHRVGEVGAEAVRRAVGLRLARLRADAAAIARAVSILGDGTDLALAAALAERSEHEAFEAARALAESDLLRSRPELSFVHPVVRAAVEAELSPAERDRAHRRAAGLLADAGADPERVAMHLLKVRPAGDAEVVDALRAAAREALARGATESSVAYLTRALEEPPAHVDRASVLVDLGVAESLVSGPVAAEHLAEALALVPVPQQRAEISLILGRTLYFLARPDEAIQAYERALAELPTGDSPMRRMLEAALCHASFTVGGVPLADAARRHAADYEPYPADLGGRWLNAVVAYSDAQAGASAAAAAGRAQWAASDGVFVEQDNGGSGFALAALVLMHADWEVIDLLDAGLARAHVHGSVFAFAAGKVFRARARLLRGELEDAEADAREALEGCEAWNVAIGPPYAAAYLADALMEQGRLEEAAEAIARGGHADRAPLAHSHWLLEVEAKLRILRGDLREGLEALGHTGRRLEEFGLRNPSFMPWRSLAAHAHLAMGEREQALRLAEEELELSRRWGAPRALAMSLRAAGLARGGTRCIDTLREALEVVEGSPARLEHAKVLVELGAALRRANARTESRGLLRQGLEQAVRCGARPLAERAESELLASGARLRREQAGGVDALTPSERRVADLAAAGASNRDIAQALFVTTKTVEVHLSSTYRKLGIRSRAQLPRQLTPA